MYITWTGVPISISGSNLCLDAIQLYHNHLGLHADNLSHFKYQLMLRALPLTMRHFPAQKLPVTPEILDSICNICDQLGDLGTVLKVAFTLSYYGFLRQSNIPPPSSAAFDPSRHTTRADVTQQLPGLVVRLKWSKTHQAPGVPALIPSLPGHRTDPLTAFMHILHVIPTRYPADPLLLLPSRRNNRGARGCWFPGCETPWPVAERCLLGVYSEPRDIGLTCCNCPMQCYDWHCNPLTRQLPSDVSSMPHALCIQLTFFKLLFSRFPHNHSFWRPSNFLGGFIPLFYYYKGQFINLSLYY